MQKTRVRRTVLAWQKTRSKFSREFAITKTDEFAAKLHKMLLEHHGPTEKIKKTGSSYLFYTGIDGLVLSITVMAPRKQNSSI